MSGVLVYLPSDSRRDPVRKELAPGETLRFGRGAPGRLVDLHLDNPTIPRLAGEILAVDDHWRLSNFSNDRTFVVENPEGAGEYLRIPPRRASCPVPFEFSRVVLTTQGPTASFQVYAPQHMYLESVDLELPEPDGSSTISAFSLDQDAIYFLVLVALCEPRLRDESSTAVPTSRQVVERLSASPDCNPTLRAVNFHIDYLAEQKLRVKQPFEEERQDGKRAAVVDVALRFGLVREEHLSLLPTRRPPRTTDT
ncbi:serine/threonine protein kinase [Actinomadura sp. HBU206391]|uniref:serine/threonine protein kinase n=1 Tax=Actinomadura sp. HBU206391 TaxID=2731692 RepID=UPI00164FAD81|nr:serine/threonine protein kinase [Actinomadura sp. HBU206391]MBC6458093.1 serine/threonine protein kinase [Actinomadura sp. HBU206391]